MDLETELQEIYDSEININISWIWDAGFRVEVGDLGEESPHNAVGYVKTAAEILPWLQEAIQRIMPTSRYATELRGETFAPKFVQPEGYDLITPRAEPDGTNGRRKPGHRDPGVLD
jgi:hypothetical protein